MRMGWMLTTEQAARPKVLREVPTWGRNISPQSHSMWLQYRVQKKAVIGQVTSLFIKRSLSADHVPGWPSKNNGGDNIYYALSMCQDCSRCFSCALTHLIVEFLC